MKPIGHTVPVSLCVLVLVVLGIRLFVLNNIYEAHPARTVAQDSAGYDRLAKSLLDSGEFSSRQKDGVQPEIIRTPGYPIYLAVVYGLTGTNQQYWALAVQVVISALTLLPLFWIGNMIWNPATGLLAAVFYALDYISFLASQMLLTDSLYVFFLVVALCLGVLALKGSNRLKTVLLAFGLALGVATLIRPVSYYLIVPVLLGFCWVYTLRSGWRNAVLLTLLILLPWLVIVGGWQARNYMVADTAQISAIQGINLMRYRGAHIVGYHHNLDLLDAREEFMRDIPGHARMTTAEKSRAYTEKTLALIKSDPDLAVQGQIRGTGQLLLVPGEAETMRYLGLDSPAAGVAGDFLRLQWDEFADKWLTTNTLSFAVFVIALGYMVLLYTGSGIAVFNLLRSKSANPAAQVFLLGVALYFILVSGGPEGYPRLRMPIMPVLALFAAAGWLQLVNLQQKLTHIA